MTGKVLKILKLGEIQITGSQIHVRRRNIVLNLIMSNKSNIVLNLIMSILA